MLHEETVERETLALIRRADPHPDLVFAEWLLRLYSSSLHTCETR
jgi:hypothetical protein